MAWGQFMITGGPSALRPGRNMPLQAALERVLAEYPAAHREPLTAHPLALAGFIRGSLADELQREVGPYDIIARSKDVPLCLGRPSGRLTGHRWLGQGFQQRPDLGVRVASVAAQGTEIRQPAVLCPATHRLWRHLEELGDLGCT
jgi:hypothetical protein